MSVRVNCPHCRSVCLVAEQHLGKAVQCGHCARSFKTRSDPAPVTRIEAIRLDVAAASPPFANASRFLVQHGVSCNLDKRQEQARLMVASEAVIRAISTTLLPLLETETISTEQALAAVLQAIRSKMPHAPAAVVMIHESEAHLGMIGAVSVYHSRAGRLQMLTRQPAGLRQRLAAGDWLVVEVGAASRAAPAGPARLAGSTLQSALAAASSAALFAHQLAASSNSTILAVRCH